MKKYLLSAAAALAIAAPGVASADDAADIGFHYANVEPDGGSDFDIYGLDGAYAHTFGSGMVLQFEGQSDRFDGGGTAGTGYAAVSFGMRNQSHAVYGFVGMGDAFSVSTTNVGVGGQLYLGSATINGSIGYADFDDVDANVTDARVDGTWFFTDNLGLTGKVGWAEAEGAGPDFDWTTLGLGGAWRPTGSNFTINAGYENIDTDGGEADVWRLGLTYNIGTGSERERSQRGASLNGARNLYEDSLVIFY